MPLIEGVTPPFAGAQPRLKAVPRPEDADKRERIEERVDWDWQRLSYPADRIPPGDWRGKAMEHVKKHVPGKDPKGVVTFRPGAAEASSSELRTLGLVTPSSTSWTEMGPKPLDSTGTTNNAYQYGVVSGRANSITFVPTTPPGTTAYVGGPVGGLWKTANCCSTSTTWTPLWDSSTFPAQSVGAIALDPGNSSIVYVGTGDSQVPAYDMYGNGIYKSTDAGSTWTQYGASLMSPYMSKGAPGTTCCDPAPDQDIKTIVVDPNSGAVIAGASYGLFISYDGGVSWTQYFVVDPNSATYNTSAQRVTSILLDSSGATSQMYIAIGYPYSSTRRPNLVGGANGVYSAPVPASGTPGGVLPGIALLNGGWPAGTGNGGVTSNVGRIELAWDATHTHTYAHVATYGYNGGAVGDTLGIWHSSNRGASWNLLNNTAAASWKDCSGAAESQQDWYDLYIAVDPNNDKILYSGRVNLWKLTVDAGYANVVTSSATGRTCPTNAPCDISAVYATGCAAYGHIHPDEHGFAFVPGSNPTRFVAANDGGVFLGDGNASSSSYTDLNGPPASGGISTNEFYAGQLGADFANTGGASTQYLFGGMQDNGSASWDSSQSNLQWVGRSTGGDGFFTAFDPIGGTISAGNWATEYTNGSLYCSSTGANGPFGSLTGSSNCSPGYGRSEREDWSTPFIVDQWNCTNTTCGNMVLGTNFVWASTNFGGTWAKVAASDVTKGSGDVIAVNVGMSNPGSVIVGTNDGNVQWSSNVFTGTSCTAAAANTASFSCATNKSATWVNLTGANAVLPNRVINGVAFDPTTNLTFYAAVGGFNGNTPGVSGHVFRGTCSASPCTTSNFTWTDKSANLPDIPFASVQPNPNNPNQVFVGSYLGVYYTDDITANPPVWNRFQTGMPNTRVQYLAIDRGVATTPRASTTLAAFTYGRGAYVAGLVACAKPSAPGGVAATTNSCANVTVTWNAVSNATAYDVVRGTTCGTAATTFTNATSPFVDSTAVAGTSYQYWVVARNACGSSPNSACASGTRLAAPAAPSGVSASGTCTGVTVSWSASTGATSYDVVRGSSCGSASATFTGVSSPFTDTSAVAGTAYQYWIVARNACGSSANSACASGTRSLPAPSAPTGVTATKTNCSNVTVAWNASAGATQYDVVRGSSCGTAITTFTNVSSPYVDSTAVAGTTYNYWVVARNACGSSPNSACDTGVALTTAAAPGITSVNATAPNAITVNWSSVAGANSYTIYRSDGTCPGGSFSQLASGLTGTSYVDTAVVGGLSYSYEVAAVNGCGTGAPSACASATATGVCSSVPTFGGLTSVTASSGGTCGMSLSWSAGSSNCGASVTYSVYRSTVSGFTPTVSNRITTGATGTSYTDTAGLSPSTTYYYVVRAVDTRTGTEDTNTSGNTSGTTTPASCVMGAPDVQAVTVTGTGGSGATTGQNVLQWWNPAGAPSGSTITINYRINTFPSSPTDGTTILSGRAVTPGAVDGFTHTGLTNGTTYYYALWVRN